jgi:Ca2+-binding RTX toxin-like protein
VSELPPLGTAGDDTMAGSSRADVLHGLGGNDLLDGFGGNDSLFGGEGNDEYVLGPGDDYAGDWAGDDAYLYGPGDGDDQISDDSGTDCLEFGNGIDPADVTVTAEGDNYVLSFTGQPGSVTIWSGVLQDYAIEEVRFADSTVWTPTDLYVLAFG